MTVPISVQIESLFQQWISYLRDYSRASGEWKQSLKDELWQIYIQILTLGDEMDVNNNAYIMLIKSREFEQHLQLTTRNNNVYIGEKFN